jgi:c(7)-type cytochrome triheme protein
MKNIQQGLIIVLGAAALTVFPAGFSIAVHEPVPDMEHGESVTEEPASAPGKVIGGGDVLFAVQGAGNVTFSHDAHVAGIGLNCTDCHDQLYVTQEKHIPVTMAQMQEGHSCGACHNGKTAFDVRGNCGNCHAQ